MNNITVSGVINAENCNKVGGVLGCSEIINTISNVSFVGNVTASKYVGGLVGYANNGLIQQSNVAAVIEAKSYIGGIGGYLSKVTIDSCSNSGSSILANKYDIVDGKKYAYIGGYAGFGFDAMNCTNEISINYSAGGQYVGGIFGYQEYTGTNVERKNTNLHNKADISGSDYVGGIIGYSSIYALSGTEWSNENAAITGENYVGGLIGYCNSIGELMDLQVSGNITGGLYVGGVVGKGQEGNIREAQTNVNLSAKAYAGCTAGWLVKTTIYDCKNDGSTILVNDYYSIDGKKYAYVGGFVGSGYTANNCTNKVDINYLGGGMYVGGIMGYSSGCYTNQTLELTDLSNEASISGTEYVGGIFGAVEFVKDDWYYTNKYSYTEMNNAGKVSGSGNYIGGIFGYFYVNCEGGNSWVYITDATNSGDISGNEYVGGIVGCLQKNVNSSFHGSGSASGIFDPKTTGIVSGVANYGDVAGKSDISTN